MLRPAIAAISVTVLGLGAALSARTSRNGDALNKVEGVRITSHLSCDGATNPQEELKLDTKFSPGGWNRAFHLDMFEAQYCRRGDFYFFCVSHGHERWKPEWISASEGPQAPGRYWMNACQAWGTKDAPNFILSGWYQEGAASKKLAWKQAALKKVSDSPETYEFTDPNGGTARIEIGRR